MTLSIALDGSQVTGNGKNSWTLSFYIYIHWERQDSSSNFVVNFSQATCECLLQYQQVWLSLNRQPVSSCVSGLVSDSLERCPIWDQTLDLDYRTRRLCGKAVLSDNFPCSEAVETRSNWTRVRNHLRDICEWELCKIIELMRLCFNSI